MDYHWAAREREEGVRKSIDLKKSLVLIVVMTSINFILSPTYIFKVSVFFTSSCYLATTKRVYYYF